MDTGKALIDKAVELCGGEAELAHRLGVQRQLVHGWHRGHRSISPETVALLGDVLELPGEEVQRLAAWAVIENAKNAGKRERLKRAFFGVWVLGVAGVLQTAAPSGGLEKEPNAQLRQTVYTLSLAMLEKLAKAFALFWARFAPAYAGQILNGHSNEAAAQGRRQRTITVAAGLPPLGLGPWGLPRAPQGGHGGHSARTPWRDL
jgi:transcriptional regulator with XRE-family HTH domain